MLPVLLQFILVSVLIQLLYPHCAPMLGRELHEEVPRIQRFNPENNGMMNLNTLVSNLMHVGVLEYKYARCSGI